MSKFFDFKEMKNKHNCIFFDLGANIGNITSKVNSISNNIVTYSFEPVIKNFNILQKKFKNKSNITLENKAVWVKQGIVNFSVGTKNTHTNSKITKIIEDLNYDKKKYLNSYDVECVDICQYIKDRITGEEFVVIKMDIEGAEYEVLDHLIKNSGLDYVNILLIEFHREPTTGKIKEIICNIKKVNNKIRIYEEYTPGVFKEVEL